MPGRGGSGNFKAVAAKVDRDTKGSIYSTASSGSNATGASTRVAQGPRKVDRKTAAAAQKSDRKAAAAAAASATTTVTLPQRLPLGGRRGTGHNKAGGPVLRITTAAPTDDEDDCVSPLPTYLDSDAFSIAASTSISSVAESDNHHRLASSADRAKGGRGGVGNFHSPTHVQSSNRSVVSSVSGKSSKSDFEHNEAIVSDVKSWVILVTRDIRVEYSIKEVCTPPVVAAREMAARNNVPLPVPG